MPRKFVRIVSTLLTIGLIFMMVTSFATTHINFDDTKIGATDTISDKAGDTVAIVLGAIQWIGYAIAVGMLIFIGIKYVMASADEKANLKNAMIRYVVGAVLIAGGVTIASWIFNAFKQG